jgi:hypothetical protein
MTQTELGGAYHDALIDLNLATEMQVRQWRTSPADDTGAIFKITPEQCTLLGARLKAARPQYQNVLLDIAQLRKSLENQ